MREWIRPIVASAILGLVVGGVGWIVGVSELQSAVLVVVVITAAAGRHLVEGHQARSGDTWRGRWSPTAYGGRRDVAQLGRQMRTSRRTVHGRVLTRLRDLATHRLRHHGLDPTDPHDADAAEALLGTTAFQVVTGERGKPVRYRAFVHTLDVLERLGPPDPATVAAPPASTPEPR